jgi:hypothetical protein
MNGSDAIRILRRPRFGDDRHIEALGVYEQLVRLKALREEWADEQGLQVLAEIYKQRPLPEPEDLTAALIDLEVDFWVAVKERNL